VDALDLCYTKAHVDTFVIISGDSDFSPLVSKLRENNKTVIGVGVKSSTSHLLINNCDEFIYYDDLIRSQKERRAPKKSAAANNDASAAAAEEIPATDRKTAASKPAPARARKTKSDAERKDEALELVVETVDALIAERGGDEKVWGSMVKQ